MLTRVKFNGTISTVGEEPGKSSLDLFISSSCNLTKFESDRIESSEFEKQYVVFKLKQF